MSLAHPSAAVGAGGTTASAAEGATLGDVRSMDGLTPYLRARLLEGRLYPDSIVAGLPHVPAGHPLAHEWRQRADSAARLTGYLRRHPSPLVVVEIGCGNGWLSNAIAAIPGSEVVGLDSNELELGQALRVFGGRPNLTFVAADAEDAEPPASSPNVIVLASVIQYLPYLRGTIDRLLGRLADGGELHILDSPLYRREQVAAARERSRVHYERLGTPEMIDVYRHHEWAELEGLNADVLYRPDAIRCRIGRRLFGVRRSPFPWIRIRRAARAGRR